MQDSAAGGEERADAGKGASGSGRAAPSSGMAEQPQAAAGQVSFLTAALMGVALCFHSVLEVRPSPLLASQKDVRATLILQTSVHSLVMDVMYSQGIGHPIDKCPAMVQCF